MFLVIVPAAEIERLDYIIQFLRILGQVKFLIIEIKEI